MAKRDEVIFLRVSKDMKEHLREQAEKEDMTVNAYVISVLKKVRGDKA